MKEEGIGFCKTFTTAREASSTPSNFLDFSVLKMARGEKKNLEWWWAYHQFFFVFGFVVKVMLWNISNMIREKYPYDGVSAKSV